MLWNKVTCRREPVSGWVVSRYIESWRIVEWGPVSFLMPRVSINNKFSILACRSCEKQLTIPHRLSAFTTHKTALKPLRPRTWSSFISSLSLFTGIRFTSSTTASTRFTLASTPAIETARSLLAPNSAPRGLRGPIVGTSVEFEGTIAGKPVGRRRGEPEGDAAPLGDTALRVRVLCDLRGESERLVVRRTFSGGVTIPEGRKGDRCRWRNESCDRDASTPLRAAGADVGTAMVGQSSPSPSSSPSDSSKRPSSPCRSMSKIASCTSMELEPSRSRIGMCLTLRERLA